MFKFNIVKNPTALLILLLIAIGFFVYSFNLNNWLFWDDDDWIINNNFVHTVNRDNIKFWLTHNTLAGVGLQSNYYRPFLFFTFALNWVVSETEPLLWHLVSNLIHITNAVLIFLLLKRFNLGSPKRSNLIPFLTALIFTIHPLQTEAITYISGRGDALVVFFMLLALYLWITDIASRYDKTVDNRHRKSVILKSFSLAALVLAILSRETGIIFPFLLMIFYVALLSDSRFDLKTEKGRTFLNSVKKAFYEALPYFGIVLVYGILRLTVLNFQNTLNFYTVANPYSENLHYRLFTFMHVLVDYFKLLFVPTGLHMERSMTVHTSLFQWPVWLGFLIIFGILAMLYRLYKIRHPDFKIWFFGWGWFFIALGPVSGITPVNAVIYEHWLYLPMVGFWLIVSFYLIKLFDYLKKTQKLLFVVCVLLFGAYISFFGLQSIKRNILWGNPVEFYKDILRYEPNSIRINNNLGNLYYNIKDMENAEYYYRKGIEENNVFAQPYYNLGTIVQSKGDIVGAIRLYEKAIETDPSFYYPYQNMAFIYAQQGNLTKAADNIEVLKLLLPNNARVYYNSALVYLALNNKEQALKDLQSGLKHAEPDPDTGVLIKELIKRLEN